MEINLRLDRSFGSGFEHGGNIYSLAEELKMQERKIIDFSASINPLGVSKKVKAEIRKHLKYLHNYPDPEAKRLRKFLAQYHGIDPETILCGNGSTELIYLIIGALKPKCVLIPAPTFSEYERACKMSDELRVMSYELKRENNFEINPDEFIAAIKGDSHSELRTPNSNPPSPPLLKGGKGGLCDMAFLCNPNNPTGRLIKKDDILKIADAAMKLKCHLIIDEAFIDFCNPPMPPFTKGGHGGISVKGYTGGLESGYSLIPNVQNNPYLIVLRSMTKFYALSGLRIGYGVFPQHLIGILKKYKEPWTVNSLAQRAAVIALKDKIYRNETLSLIGKEKIFLEKNFEKLGIGFYPSDANFYLLKINDVKEISQKLKSKGILVRDCSNFRGLDSSHIRIAVKSRRENTILLKNLAAMLHVRG